MSPDQGVLAAVAASVRAAPDRVAVRAGEHEVSYADLWQRSGALAATLRDQASPGPVALLLHPSVDLVVAQLAVRRAGRAYVCLDPDLPDARLSRTAAAAAPALVVTDDPARVDSLGLGAPVLPPTASDASAPGPDEEPDEDLDDLAYLIYTSGTTGEPKGVEITAGNLAHLLRGAVAATIPDGPHTWTLAHSSSFDMSVWELWGALSTGATLVVVPRAVVRDPEELARALVRSRTTILNITPSAWRRLRPSLDRCRDDLALQRVLFGGERLAWRDVEGWLGGPRLRMVNLYGITEVTVHATVCVLDDLEPGGPDDSPIGVALPGYRLHLVAPGTLEPVEPGAVGELLVGGGGVARGYAGAPALTAERFVEADLGAGPARLYRSGDLAWADTAGALHYVGRADRQLKLRGYRVELGEIEHALVGHPDVLECVVEPWRSPDDEEDHRVLAWAVRDPGSRTETAEVLDWLRARLPHYLVPAALTWIDALPLTSSGKIDRDRLLEQTLTAADAPFVATSPPATEPDPAQPDAAHADPAQALRTAVARILRREDCDLGRDFFSLGGDSLLAVRLVALLEEMGWQVDLKELFLVDALTELVGQMHPGPMDASAGSGPSPARSTPTRAAAQRVTVQPAYAPQALRIAALLEAGESDPLVLQQMYRIEGALDSRRLEHAVRRLIDRRDSLRSWFESRDAEVVQVFGPPGSGGGLLTREAPDAEEARRWIVEDVGAALPLLGGPVARFGLARVAGRDEHWLGVCVSHSVADGQSLPLILADLAALYAGDDPPPAPDFASWARRRAHSLAAGEDEARRFWRTAFPAAPPMPPLQPTPEPVPPVIVPPEHRLDAPTVRGLRAVAAREGVSLYMLLLAAVHAVGASRRPGAPGDTELTYAVNVGNRHEPGSADVVGCLTHRVMLRVGGAGTDLFTDLLADTRRTLLRALTPGHVDVPFRVVRSWLREWYGDCAPLEGLTYVVLGPDWGSTLDLEGVRVEQVAWPEEQVGEESDQWWFTEVGDEVELELQFNQRYRTQASAEEVSGAVITFLTDLARGPR